MSMGSRHNLAGSKANLTGSKANLSNTRSSASNLAKSAKLSASNKNLGQAGLAPMMPGGEGGNAAGLVMVDQSMLDKAAETGQRIYENTYQLKPVKKFPTELIRQTANEILKKNLEKVNYNASTAPELCKSITGQVLQAVRKIDLPRYKLMVHVNIGEFKGQGIRVASRAVWDADTDSYTSASYKNASLFAVAMVFGTYFE